MAPGPDAHTPPSLERAFWDRSVNDNNVGVGSFTAREISRGCRVPSSSTICAAAAVGGGEGEESTSIGIQIDLNAVVATPTAADDDSIQRSVPDKLLDMLVRVDSSFFRRNVVMVVVS